MRWTWTGYYYCQIEIEVMGPVSEETWSQIKLSILAFYEINNWGKRKDYKHISGVSPKSSQKRN